MAGCVAPAGPAPEGVASVRAEPRPGVVAPIARGETTLVVRAVPAGASGQELRGAACRAESAYFTADFRSPAQLLMPDFGEAAPVVTVTCRDGAASGTAAATPERAWSGGLGGWPAVGVSVGTGDVRGRRRRARLVRRQRRRHRRGAGRALPRAARAAGLPVSRPSRSRSA